MNATFTATTTVRGTEVVGKAYEVHIDGAFWGWVAGENRSYVAMPKDGFAWGAYRRTKMQAVEANLADAEAAKVASDWRSQQVPTDVKVIRLTVDNIDVEGPQLAGWLLDGGEDLGEVVNARLTRDGYANAMIIGSRSRDVLGLPCTITAYRL